MHRWLNAYHVLRLWYGEGTSYREIEGNYLPRIEGRERVRPLAVLYAGTPIGYLQDYPVSQDEQYARLVGVENSVGIDLFIGEKEYLHGGHILKRSLAEYVFPDPALAVCVIGPEPNNTPAIGAYENAGFRFFKTIQAPGEPEYLMRLGSEDLERGSDG